MEMFYDNKAGEKLIAFVARQDAEKALQQMKDFAAEYGDISVRDVDEMTGRTPKYDDYRTLVYGWRYSDLPKEVETVRINILCLPVYAIRLPKEKDLRDRPSHNWQKNARPKDGHLNDLYAKEAFEQINKAPKRVNYAPLAKGEKLNYKFEEKSDDYEAGYRAGYKACAADVIKKYEETLAQMKKELEEVKA